MEVLKMFQRNPKQRETLKYKNVCIVGCGSIGSALADMLVRSGVEYFTLVDPDEFSEENLARHLLKLTDIGENKAEALARHLGDINIEVTPTVCPTTIQN